MIEHISQTQKLRHSNELESNDAFSQESGNSTSLEHKPLSESWA